MKLDAGRTLASQPASMIMDLLIYWVSMGETHLHRTTINPDIPVLSGFITLHVVSTTNPKQSSRRNLTHGDFAIHAAYCTRSHHTTQTRNTQPMFKYYSSITVCIGSVKVNLQELFVGRGIEMVMQGQGRRLGNQWVEVDTAARECLLSRTPYNRFGGRVFWRKYLLRIRSLFLRGLSQDYGIHSILPLSFFAYGPGSNSPGPFYTFFPLFL